MKREGKEEEFWDYYNFMIKLPIYPSILILNDIFKGIEVNNYIPSKKKKK